MKFSQQVIDDLKNGKIGLIATDTIYGLVCSALIPESIEKIYQLKKRNPRKPMIVLISSINDFDKLSIKINSQDKAVINKYWPGPTSIILPCKDPKLSYLHRNTFSIAVRLPIKKELRALLRKTGPLVATSANIEGLPPAKTVEEAKKYFTNRIDFYINEGFINEKHSKLIKVDGIRIRTLRN